MTLYLATGTADHQPLPAADSGRAPGNQVEVVSPGVVFYTWRRSDPRPALPPLPGLNVGATDDYRLIAELARLDLVEVLARVQAGHRPYLARIAGAPVAYGWSALRQASIGEVGLAFPIPATERYLWDFATLAEWRGLGIYPRLLQAILAREVAEAERFWIGHVPQNLASGRGMVKAGFRRIGTIAMLNEGRIGFIPDVPAGQARAGAALLGIPMRAATTAHRRHAVC